MFRRKLLGAFVCAAGLLSVATASQAVVPREEPFPVKDKVTVVDFGASWCATCPESVALMKKMQKVYGDKVAFVVIDIDEYPDIDVKYMVESMPQQLFYDMHGEPIWQHNGNITEEALRERVDILLKHAEEDKAKAAGKAAAK